MQLYFIPTHSLLRTCTFLFCILFFFALYSLLIFLFTFYHRPVLIPILSLSFLLPLAFIMIISLLFGGGQNLNIPHICLFCTLFISFYFYRFFFLSLAFKCAGRHSSTHDQALPILPLPAIMICVF
ncbi:hypothetical protein DFH27DRAFT_177599 [Peziza echinospora]|nr:hypothetical protein DFH27DRAFT_177599 [Peziza echinospora]